MINVWELSTNENNKIFDIFLGQCIVLSETLNSVSMCEKSIVGCIDQIILNPSINTQKCTLVEKVIYDK